MATQLSLTPFLWGSKILLQALHAHGAQTNMQPQYLTYKIITIKYNMTTKFHVKTTVTNLEIFLKIYFVCFPLSSVSFFLSEEIHGLSHHLSTTKKVFPLKALLLNYILIVKIILQTFKFSCKIFFYVLQSSDWWLYNQMTL